MSYVFIELSKFAKKAEELEKIEDYWLYFLAGRDDTKAPPACIKDQWVLKAYELLERLNWSEAEYDAYIRARLMAEAEELTLQEKLEHATNKGVERGLQEGIEKGKLEGKLELAKKMLSRGQS